MATNRRSSFSFPRQWNPNRAPNFPIEIDPQNTPPGLLFSLPVANSNFVDLVSGLKPTVTGSPLLLSSPLGNVLNVNSGALGYLLSPPASGSFEALVQAGPSLSGGQTILTWNAAANGSSGTYDRQLSGASGAYSFYIFDGGTQTVSESGSDWSANNITHLVATSDGTNIKIYVNGALSGTFPAGTGYMGYAPGYLVLGSLENGFEWTGGISLVNIASVAWSPSQIAARAAAPFAMFRPVVARVYGSSQPLVQATVEAPVSVYNNMTDSNVTLDDPLSGTSIAASFVTDSTGGSLTEVDLLLIR